MNESIHHLEILSDRIGNQKQEEGNSNSNSNEHSSTSNLPNQNSQSGEAEAEAEAEAEEGNQKTKKLKSLISSNSTLRNHHHSSSSNHSTPFDNLKRSNSTSNIQSTQLHHHHHQHQHQPNRLFKFKSTNKFNTLITTNHSSSSTLTSTHLDLYNIQNSFNHHHQKTNSTNALPINHFNHHHHQSIKKSHLIHKLIRGASLRFSRQPEMSSTSQSDQQSLLNQLQSTSTSSPSLLSPSLQRSCSASTSSVHTAFVTVPNSPFNDPQDTFLSPLLVSSSTPPTSPHSHLPGALSVIEEIQTQSNDLHPSQTGSEHSLERDPSCEPTDGKDTELSALQDTISTHSPSAHLSDPSSPHSVQKISTATLETSSPSQTNMEEIQKTENPAINQINSEAGIPPRSPASEKDLQRQKSELIPSGEKKENLSLLDHQMTGVIVVNQSRAGSVAASERPSSRSSRLYHTEEIPKFELNNLPNTTSQNSSSQRRPSPSMSKSLENIPTRKFSVLALPDHLQSFRSLMDHRTSVSSRNSASTRSTQPPPDMTFSHPPTDPPTERSLASLPSAPKTRKSKSVAKLVGRIGKKLRPKAKTEAVTGNSANKSHHRPVSTLPTKPPDQTTGHPSTRYGDLTSPTAPGFAHSRVADSDLSYGKVTPIPLSPTSDLKPQAEGSQNLSENAISSPQSSVFCKVRPLPTPKPKLRSPRKYDPETDPDSDSENDTRPQNKTKPPPFNFSSIVNELQQSPAAELVYQLPALPSPISPFCSLFTDTGRISLEKPKRPSTSAGYAHLITTSQICDPKGKARMLHSVELTSLAATAKGKAHSSNSVDLDRSPRYSAPQPNVMEVHRSLDPSSALSSTSSQPTTLFGHVSDQSELETPATQLSQEDHIKLPRTRISLHPRSSLRIASSPSPISTVIPVNSDQLITTSLHREGSASSTPRPYSTGTSDLPRQVSASVDHSTTTTPQKEVFPVSSSAHSHGVEVTPWDYQDIPMRSSDEPLSSPDHSRRIFANTPSSPLVTSPKPSSSRQRASTLFFGTFPGVKSPSQATPTEQNSLPKRTTQLSGSLNDRIRRPGFRNDLSSVQRSKSESRRDMFLQVNESDSTTSSTGTASKGVSYRWSFSSPNSLPDLKSNQSFAKSPISLSPTTTSIAHMIQSFTAPINLDRLPLKVSPSSPPSDQKDEDNSTAIPQITTLLTAQPSSLWRSHSDSVPRKPSLLGDPGLTSTSANTSHRFSRMITRSQSTANLASPQVGSSSIGGSNLFTPSRRRGSCNETTSRLTKPPPPGHESRPRPMTAAPSSFSRGTTPIKVDSPVKLKLLARDGEERTEDYLERLGQTLEKSMIISALAASPDPFHLSAIVTYLDSFEFAHDPIDLALRKLLMAVSLPKETQQIDRVMEAFAKRYVACNPKLFSSSDQVYILAFSIIMLHTDAFNKHNRGKMSRADYVKNTRMDGVPNEVLEYIYDNVTYTPFVFVDEDRDITGQKLEPPETSSSFFTLGASTNSNSGSMRDKKQDPYLMIARGLTHELRPDIESFIPSRNPFSFTGTVSCFDSNRLRKSFAQSPMIQIVNHHTFAGKSSSVMNRLVSEVPSDPNLGVDESLMTNLKAVKVGLVFRKEVGDGLIKNVTKKWKEWCVILTRSQLLFMKDTTLVDELQQSFYEASRMNADNTDEQLVVRITGLKPDTVFSLEDGIALLDLTYKRRAHTFRLILAKEQQQYLIEVADENEMNSWITHINFAATFKSTDLPFRTWQVSEQLNSNPLSHSTSSIGANSLLLRKSRGSTSSSFCGRSGYEEEDLMGERGASRSRRASSSMNGSFKSRSINRRGSLVNGPTGTGGGGGVRSDTPERVSRNEPLTPGSGCVGGSVNVGVVRYELVKSKIKELENEILKAKTELNEDLRIARNLAVLTPFQISTKNRLQVSILPIAERIRILRHNLSKLICYREVLLRDNLIDKPNVLLNTSSSNSNSPNHHELKKVGGSENGQNEEEACTPKCAGGTLGLGNRNDSITEEIDVKKINSLIGSSSSSHHHQHQHLNGNRIGSPISPTHLTSNSNHKSTVAVSEESNMIGLIPEAESKRVMNGVGGSRELVNSSSINVLPGRPSSAAADHHSPISPLKKPTTGGGGWAGKRLNGIKNQTNGNGGNLRPATANSSIQSSGMSGSTNGNGIKGSLDHQAKRLTQAWGLP